MDTSPLDNILGLLALVSYVATLLPTIMRIVFPQIKKNSIPKWLLKHRRTIGIITFFFALGHGLLVIKKRTFDLFDPKTYWIYIQGAVTLIVFALLAITSNDWSIKKLKKNWKRLHQLTYPSMFLLTWHVWGKMSGHWTYITPIGIVASTGITVLFLIRLWIERQGKQQKAQAKVPPKAVVSAKSTIKLN
ncbi:ferric reductase-like transmembrane domain-containing protein [Iningainema sp. BLCCT55]|uniref:Ferric reductase-like transmembrane domain-containing protein n=2 Tax=Iningainema TaxID=1932705 RepID=A0A8J6XSX9_9CYAN|nr:ferric reductase-like transmembrane domain-containing protein [Iningainema tapete BLCC-T55]